MTTYPDKPAHRRGARLALLMLFEAATLAAVVSLHLSGVLCRLMSSATVTAADQARDVLVQLPHLLVNRAEERLVSRSANLTLLMWTSTHLDSPLWR